VGLPVYNENGKDAFFVLEWKLTTVSAQVSAENMIGLQESTKCAMITKVTSTTFKSRDEKFLLSCVKTSGLAVFSISYMFQYF